MRSWRTRVYITVNSVTGPQVSTVKAIADPQLNSVENRHQLRKIPRAMRNFSYLKVFFSDRNFSPSSNRQQYTRDFDMNKAVSGLMLIELVVVISILAILTAFAFPHFASQEVEARKAAVNGLGGSVRAATAQAHILSLYPGNAATITMNGQTITMLNGYPNEASIVNTLQDFTGFQYIPAAVAMFQKTGAAIPAFCKVTYANALVGLMPMITVVTTGC